MPKPMHIHMRDVCAICATRFELKEPCIGLLESSGLTAHSSFTETFKYTDSPPYFARPKIVSGRELCHRRNCTQCYVMTSSAEASFVHPDCLQVVLKECKKHEQKLDLDRLWISTAWRVPWRQIGHMRIEPPAVVPHASHAASIGIEGLDSLPPEVIRMVQSRSPTSQFWKLSAAHAFARRLAQPVSNEFVSVKLGNLFSWERGGSPVVEENIEGLPIIRLVIDSFGIRSMERLPERPSTQTARTDEVAFVVIHQANVNGIKARFKAGLMRLKAGEPCPGLQAWDIPNPPALNQCNFHRGPVSQDYSIQFRTADLSRATGLTFFFRRGETIGVHVHSATSPSAAETYNGVSLHLPNWIYVPIAEGDSVEEIGLQLPKPWEPSSGCWFFRMKLAGDVVVGFPYDHLQAGQVLCRSTSPMTLILGVSEFSVLDVVGTYTRDQGHAGAEQMVLGNTPSGDSLPGRAGDYYSRAPLKDVVQTWVFLGEKHNLCAGILFKYANGALRSIGQCRVGVDSAESYENPTCLCILSGSDIDDGPRDILKGNVVKFQSEPEHFHSGHGWVCRKMEGELEFMFGYMDSSSLRVVDEHILDPM